MNVLALRSYHELDGAVFAASDGWEVPASYGFGDAEVLNVRRAAGLTDLGDRVTVRVEGPDRVTFLNSLLTGDVQALAPGRAMSTLLLTEKGKVTGDLRLLALSDALLIDVDPLVGDAVLGSIEKHLISDDVTLTRVRAAHLGVHGPAASSLLGRALGRDIPPLPLDATAELDLGGRARLWLVGVDYTGVAGIDAISLDEDLSRLWRRLVDLGATPFGRDALETLRIEAGRPRAGIDMDETTIALEAGMEKWISYTKGCYLGQETIARATYQGHMNRSLVGLSIEGDFPPEPRQKVWTTDGKEVGFVTSATYSPTLRRVIALGYVRAGSRESGTHLLVDRAGWQLRAAVVPLPFVGPDGKVRPFVRIPQRR